MLGIDVLLHAASKRIMLPKGIQPKHIVKEESEKFRHIFMCVNKISSSLQLRISLTNGPAHH